MMIPRRQGRGRKARYENCRAQLRGAASARAVPRLGAVRGLRRERALQGASGTHAISAWIADTAPRRMQGLMFVRALRPDDGMLFVYRQARYVSMWMKNTYVALDMLFIDRGGRIVNIVENARPLTLDTISSAAPVLAVLELPAGTVARYGLRAGDRVLYAGFDTPAAALPRRSASRL
jgi:uncharacterized membrane protein (UPF0127 family)